MSLEVSPAYLRELQERQKAQQEKLAQRRLERQAVAVSMADLVNDPKWQTYLNLLQPKKERFERALERLKEKLLGGYLEPKDYIEAMIEQAKLTSGLFVLNECVDEAKRLANETIDDGKGIS